MSDRAVVRRFRGEVDYPVMFDIMQACNEVAGLEYNESVEDVARVFSHLTHCNPFTDMRFVEVDGEAAGYSRVFWKDEFNGARLYLGMGFVVPKWRRLGLGSRLLAWNEARLREIAAGHPSELEKVFQTWTTDSIPGAMRLFERYGYHIARTMVEMIRPIGAPLPLSPLPASLEIRPATPEHYCAVWDAWEEAYRDHWGYAPRSENEFKAWQASRLFQPELWKIVWDGDQVAGMVLNYIDHRRNEKIGIERGYTQNIFVRRPWRRRGLARALLSESIRMFALMGMSETYLGVDTESLTGADHFYESMGYRNTMKRLIYRKPMVSD